MHACYWKVILHLVDCASRVRKRWHGPSKGSGMKQQGTRSDRVAKFGQLIDLLNAMLATHVRDDEVLVSASSRRPVALHRTGHDRPPSDEKPDFAARLKTLQLLPRGRAIQGQIALLIDCRVDWSHQVPISASRLERAFDAAEVCCQHLDEPAVAQSIVALRRQPMHSHLHLLSQKTAAENARLRAAIAERDQQLADVGSLLERLVYRAMFKARSWVSVLVRPWQEAFEHPVGLLLQDRRAGASTDAAPDMQASTVRYLPTKHREAA